MFFYENDGRQGSFSLLPSLKAKQCFYVFLETVASDFTNFFHFFNKSWSVLLRHFSFWEFWNLKLGSLKIYEKTKEKRKNAEILLFLLVKPVKHALKKTTSKKNDYLQQNQQKPLILNKAQIKTLCDVKNTLYYQKNREISQELHFLPKCFGALSKFFLSNKRC